MKKIMLFGILPVMALISSCSHDDEPGKWQNTEPSPYRRIDLPASTRAAADANAGFAFKLFNEIASVNSSDNVVCSPFSVFTVLSMLANGDNGESRDEILRLLGYPEGADGISGLNQYCHTLLTELPDADRSTKCDFVNSIWIKSGYGQSFKPEFKEKCNDFFYAPAFVLPDDGTAYKVVNKWVSDKTDGRLSDMLSDADGFDMALVNVSLFKGKWISPFDPSMTSSAVFHNVDGSESDAMFMHSKGKSCSYHESENLRGVSLGIGNGNFSLMLIRTDSGLPVSLDLVKWNELVQESRLACVTMSVPRFISEFKKDILDQLMDLGLTRVVDDEQGLKDIVEQNDAYLSFVRHGAKFEMNETGVEAVAATIGGMMSSGVPEIELSVDIDFDVPFTYVIRETSTNTILFIGNISKLP
jgi:serpin B